ncbi:MAG: Ycf66 family protein [Cyanobium sp.]
MVNASLNWASIVGIVLAVGGALLFFLRNFKPALARDTDVFFAAIGLLCGGILFFQGWRLDPILQFGQFLLAGTTVFFAYESVRLRAVTTEQARRSSYFDDEEPLPARPRGGLGGGYDNDYDRFEEPERIQRRIRSRDDVPEEDFYRPRRTSRAAIPERAASRRSDSDDWDSPRRSGRSAADEYDADRPSPASRYGAGPSRPASLEFGARRRDREAGPEPRRGSRPTPAADTPRSSRRPAPASGSPSARSGAPGAPSQAGVPQGAPIRPGNGGGRPSAGGEVSDADFAPINRPPSPQGSGGPSTASGAGSAAGSARPRDNSSRFDD